MFVRTDEKMIHYSLPKPGYGLENLALRLTLSAVMTAVFVSVSVNVFNPEEFDILKTKLPAL